MHEKIVAVCATNSYIAVMERETDLFTRLGGARAMAAIVGEAPSTVQSWKAAERIPAHKQPIVIDKVRAAGHNITADDVVYPMGRPSSEQAAA
ncbi:carph-isopro domain-containing protein [uncultured Sphingomonas sp.]|uniref:carph-isopro domain-containing protein n=1 Tax=uncultured Sphingomonas sp. TaxID=158754 RepID=UPI0025D704A4|nr:hypothetical protein [uncultured Sphingomonas sp.]